jgi:hypothetical protein
MADAPQRVLVRGIARAAAGREAAAGPTPTSCGGLRLAGTKVTGASLPALSSLPGLEELSLADSAVSDDGVKLFAGMKTLRTLALERTKVSPRPGRRRRNRG